jgi:hypothetical protein
MRAVATLMAFALAMPAASLAQDVPNLTGTWVLQADKSDFGMTPAPQSRTDVIVHQEPKLTIKRTIVAAPAQENTINLVYVVDGKPHKNMAGPDELTSILSWQGRTLVTVSTVEMAPGQVTITDRVSVSDDGKTMTLLRSMSVQGQEAKLTMVFAKQ